MSSRLTDSFRAVGGLVRGASASLLAAPTSLRAMAAPRMAAMARVMPWAISDDDDDGEILVERAFPPRRVQKLGQWYDPDYIGIIATLAPGSPGAQDAQGVVTLGAGLTAQLTLGGTNAIGAKVVAASLELSSPDLTFLAAVPFMFRVERTAGKPLVLPSAFFLPVGRIYRHPATTGPSEADTIPFTIDTTVGVTVFIHNKSVIDQRFVLAANP